MLIAAELDRSSERGELDRRPAVRAGILEEGLARFGMQIEVFLRRAPQ